MQNKEELDVLLVNLLPELLRRGGGLKGYLNSHDIEDAVQDAVVEILEKLPDYDVHTSFKALAHLIVRRQGNRQIERCKCQRRLMERYEPLFKASCNEPDDPAKVAINNEQDDRLWKAIQYLPELDRMAVGLRYYEGYSYQDIADVMGFDDADAVNACLRRARRNIKTFLKLMEKGGAA